MNCVPEINATAYWFLLSLALIGPIGVIAFIAWMTKDMGKGGG